MTPVQNFPILGHDDLSAILVDRGQYPITAGRFLADAAVLAKLLPDHGYMVNLCSDRYRFVVGFLAALHRRQVTLLPSSEAPAQLTKLVADYPSLYFLRDQPAATDGMSFAFPQSLVGPDVEAVPKFSAASQAAVLFTSGSTGAAVPNPRSWGALVNSTRAAAKKLGLEGLDGAHILGTIPHQHSYGLESIIMLSLQSGFAFYGARSLLPADIIADLGNIPEPRILVTTPIHLRSLVEYDGNMPAVSRIICATAPLMVDLARRAEDRFKAQLYEIYGCSEVGQIAVRRSVETPEWSCIDGIVLTQKGDDIWASGPAAAASASLNDIVELRGPDRFLLHGRKSDIVNIAGKRSSLSHLNHHLNSIPGVRDGVFMFPDKTGDFIRLTAYVVAPGMSAEEILSALRPHLDPAFLPRPIHFVDTLPRNALGKLPADAMGALR
ncbi:MAG: beta-hydroxyacyl-ACP dehydratase [Rhodospirillales bacterium]|nr:beta-hydroxyacyl-ACP dehydratase [Rhodospirillales bacterium]